MSKASLADETFGDISLFVSSNPNNVTAYNEASTTSIISDRGVEYDENLERVENQAQDSETESKLESLSGPEIWSGLNSWENSDQGSGFGHGTYNDENGQTTDGFFSDRERLPNTDFDANTFGPVENDATIETESLTSTERDRIVNDASIADLDDQNVGDKFGKAEKLLDTDLKDDSSEQNKKVFDSIIFNDGNSDDNKNSLHGTESNLHGKIGENIVEDYPNSADELTKGTRLNGDDAKDDDENLTGPSLTEESEYLDDENVSKDDFCPDVNPNTNVLDGSELDHESSVIKEGENPPYSDNESIKGVWSDIDLEEDDTEMNKSKHDDNISINNSEGQDSCSQGSQQSVVVVEINIENGRPDRTLTILEVWCCFAMMFGVTPYWIFSNGRVTTIKRSTFTSILWTTSVVFYMIEIFNILPKISSVLSKDQDGNAYLKLGNHVAFALFRVSLTFIAIRNSNYLTKANDLLISLPRGRMTTMKAAICLILLTCYGIISMFLYIWLQTELKFGFKDVTFLKILQRLECVGKMQLTMSRNCIHSSHTSTGSIIWSAIGLITTSHEILTEIVICLGILILCATLLYTTYDIEGSEERDPNNEFAHATLNDLTLITNMAENLSNFIREALLGYLLYNATETAKMVLLIFSDSKSVFMSLAMRNGIVFIALFMGSLAAVRINQISDAISSRVNANPSHGRPGSAILLGYIQDMIFKKSIGIGVAGMFVITYKITFSYMGLIGTLITLVV